MKTSKNFIPKFNSISHLFKQRQETIFPKADNPEIIQKAFKSRREMIKNLASVPLLGAFFFGMARKTGWASVAENTLEKITVTPDYSASLDTSKLKGQVPKGKIKNIEISRLIPGGNLIAGFVYSRDLLWASSLAKAYFTDEKVIEILFLSEACGINTTIMRTDEQTIRILKEYWRRGGKIQWIAQTYPKDEDFTNIKMAVDAGAVGGFAQGGNAETYLKNNRIDLLGKSIDYTRSQGLIAGTAAHIVEVPKACMTGGIQPDFFMKTFHHHNYFSAPAPDRKGYSWCENPEETADFFKNCKIPWIAYKVLAAGAIKPDDGFRYAFENGADFTCVGMFDFQVVDNSNATVDVLNSNLKRDRKWYA
jgi:hypothetical protein